MTRAIIITVLLGMCLSMVIADSFRPRTLDEKVQTAEVVVLGTATAFGDSIRPDKEFPLYTRRLRVEVVEVLWPPSFTNRSDIVFQYDIMKHWPRSWWDYTNTPGVFFLQTNTNSALGQWDKLDRFDDWIESPTRVSEVLESIQRQKGIPTPAELRVPGVPYPLTTKFDGKPENRLAYMTAFRDGYVQALAGSHYILKFAPSTEKERAEVLGHADGQLAGDAIRAKQLEKRAKVKR